MDILHTQLTAIQNKLAFVQTDPIDWRYYVLVFSWGICLFESYLLYAYPSILITATEFYTHARKTRPSAVQLATVPTLLEASAARSPCRSLYTSGVRKISEIRQTQGQVFNRLWAV
jgi:hypothetical protein